MCHNAINDISDFSLFQYGPKHLSFLFSVPTFVCWILQSLHWPSLCPPHDLFQLSSCNICPMPSAPSFSPYKIFYNILYNICVFDSFCILFVFVCLTCPCHHHNFLCVTTLYTCLHTAALLYTAAISSHVHVVSPILFSL